jgi:MFS family permease
VVPSRLGAISGPLIGGALLTAGIAYPWGFYVFAVVAAVGAVAVAAVGVSATKEATTRDHCVTRTGLKLRTLYSIRRTR